MKYEKWSFGYYVIKQYVRFIDWIINNKIILLNTHNIQKDKPILITANHQNALSDALAIVLHTKLQPVWLARADIFKNKMLANILRFLKLMPVYRIRDGKDNLDKNEITFANSVKVLQNNGTLALFPEGAHSGKRQMIAHKKAASRIVFMAEEKDKNLDIQIIPTGIYYTSYWKFNRNLIVSFGSPIPVTDFLDAYHENEKAASLSMRDRIYDAIDEQTINIRSKEFYHNFEQITKVYGNRFLARQNKAQTIVNRYKSDRILAKELDKLEHSKKEEISSLTKEIGAFENQVKKYKLRYWLLEKPENNLLKFAINKLLLFLGLPLFLFGFLLNAIPFFVIDIFTRKKVKEKAFWSSSVLVLSMFLFPVFYAIEFFTLGWLIPNIWLKIVLLISLPFAGKLAFKWYILLLKTIGRGSLLILSIFKNSKYKQLFENQKSLFLKLDALIKSEK